MKPPVFIFLGVLCVGLASAFTQEPNSSPPPALSILLQALSKNDDPVVQLNLLRGMNAALKGRRNVAAPPEWQALSEKLATSSSEEVREQARTLGAIFGSDAAFVSMRKTVADAGADPAARGKALESLVAAQDKGTLPLLEELTKQPGPLRRPAIRGLAAYEGADSAKLLLNLYGTLNGDEKREAINTLLARVASARALVAALDAQQIGLSDLGAPQLRQLAGFKDSQIDGWLKKHPTLLVSSPNKQAEIARYKGFLAGDVAKNADVARGRALFAQICATCHTLFGTGGNIGPELTGSNRADIDYLLQNVLDPNALIGKDYQSTTVETKDGRVLLGMVRGDDANAITLKTLGDAVIIPRSDIKSINVSEVSMMPEGLLAALSQDQVRDLFGYLASPRQVSMLATVVSAADFFNGSDLSRWRVSGEGWHVESGEIVGRGSEQMLSLISELIAEDYRFSAQIKLTGGDDAVGELAFRGQLDTPPFAGCSLSFGGNSTVNVWQYEGETPKNIPSATMLVPNGWNACEVRVAGSKARIVLNGTVAFDLTNTPGSRRNGLGIYLRGRNAELRIKDPKIEVQAP